jgi:hypothetical protein
MRPAFEPEGAALSAWCTRSRAICNEAGVRDAEERFVADWTINFTVAPQ